MRTIVWFRGKDLRVGDHQPLYKAGREGEAIPAFVMEPWFFRDDQPREAPHRMQVLLDALRTLRKNLERRGSGLVVVEGPAGEAIPRLARKWKVDRVWAHRRTEPAGRRVDQRVAEGMEAGLELFDGETLAHPEAVRTQAGDAYAVFTPFKRAFVEQVSVSKPKPAPCELPPLPDGVREDDQALPDLSDLGLERNPELLDGGEDAARKRLRSFLGSDAGEYHELRDRMDLDATSRLSLDLKFGALSVREVWNETLDTLGDSEAGESFRSQLLWREFGYNILWNRPKVLEEPFRDDFEAFPWRFDEAAWDAWTEGRTGYPVIDASARQLLGEGYVHNRARMASASFLTKHLLIDYRLGESHYMKYLADGDRAQNNMGWQWSAGCGCDAQPYFRVFNPIRQGERFDPKGDYVRRWVPELEKLPDKYIHRPWEAPEDVLEEAGVALGGDYPAPIVDHAEARERFLAVAKDHLNDRK